MNHSRFEVSDDGATARSPWLIGSLVLHVVLLFFLFRSGKPESEAVARTPSVASAARLERMSEKVRELQTRQLQEKVDSLKETLESITKLEEEKTNQLREANPELTASAAEMGESEREKAIEAQRRSLEKIGLALAAAESGDAAMVSQERQAAIESQLAAEEALSKVATTQKLSGGSVDAVENVIELQNQASQLLAMARAHEADAARSEAEAMRRQKQAGQSKAQIEQRENELVQQQQEIEQKLQDIESVKKELADSKLTLEKSEQEIAEARATFQESVKEAKAASAAVSIVQGELKKAQKTRESGKIDAAQKKVQEARVAVQKRRSDQNVASNNVNVKQREAKAAARVVSQTNQRLKQLQGQLKQIQARSDRVNGMLTKAQQQAAPNIEAIESQKENAESLRVEASAQLAAAKVAQEQAIAASERLDLTSTATTDSLAAAPGSTLETFAQARELERQIARRFKDLRAAEMSLVNQVAPDNARQFIDVALPERDSIDEEALDENARTQARMEHKLETLSAANQQAEAMDEFAKSLLAHAEGLQKPGLEITLAQRQAEAAQERHQSAQEQGGAVSDMTQLMARRSQSTGSQSVPSGVEYTQVNEQAIVAPPMPKNMSGAAPARRFGSGASRKTAQEQSGWTFVDSWYIVGPFDNPNRVNIHQKFPPESLVDLDARYRTQSSPAPVGWTFYQSDRPKIEPRKFQGEYVIYYAWTELYFEEATDVWIAVGSDDRSDLWINNVRVWSSSDTLKAWRIDEGKRKVRFEAGMNSVLYRIENGNGPWAFSLCLNLDTAVSASSVQLSADRN